MPGRRGQWVRHKPLSKQQKAEIAERCGAFIETVLKPRYLPEICPSQFNYPVDIFGKWRGDKYSFIARYRSGFADTLGEEFDAPFTRLDHRTDLGELRFDLMWKRHTGQWLLFQDASALDSALELIAGGTILSPNL